MGNIPPQPKLDQIVWFETHWPLWFSAPANFGVTLAQVTAVKTATMAARAAYDAAQAARQAARNAVVAQDEQVRMMLHAGRDTVNVIKAFIEQAGNPALWGQAGLNSPPPRAPPPAPTAPYSLSASLDSEGNVIVNWRASQPRGVFGVIYSVRRAIDGGDFVLLDSVGEKTFTDDGVQSGTMTVAYTVQAKRGRQTSPLVESLTIRFGRGGGGLTIASISTGGSGKVAA